MVLLLWVIYVISVLLFLCFRARLFIDELCSRFWCLIVKLSLSHWYPGSGVALDCIDSWSLSSFVFCHKMICNENSAWLLYMTSAFLNWLRSKSYEAPEKWFNINCFWCFSSITTIARDNAKCKMQIENINAQCRCVMSKCNFNGTEWEIFSWVILKCWCHQIDK